MAKRIVSLTTLVPTATADTTNLADATYPFILKGGNSTQRTDITEIMATGQATTNTPTYMILSRDSQVQSGSNSNGTGQTDTALNPATDALSNPVLTGNTNATNKPQRSSTLHLENLSYNAYGGGILYRPSEQDEMAGILGNTASLGEISFSAFTGGTPGASGFHMKYETK